jgi:hypothetical protein
MLVVGLVLAFLPFGSVHAQSKTLYWEQYDVDITVRPNGDLRVVETQSIVFTSGIFREGYAELVTKNSDGIDDVSVSENGQSYQFRSAAMAVGKGLYTLETLDNGNLSVTWGLGPTQNTTRSFELAYTVHGAIRRYAKGNEFQWIAISPGLHDFEIRHATVTVHLPAGAGVTLADYLTPPEFSGVPLDVSQSADGLTATWTARTALQPSAGIQIAVQFPPNTVSGGQPSWQSAYDARVEWENKYKPLVDLLLFVVGLLVLVGGPALVYLLWYGWGRDPQIDAVPEYITAPPGDMPPGVAGTLVDERADTQDIIATLVDLARRGFLEIEEVDLPSGVGLGRDFLLTQKPGDGSVLKDYEFALHKAVFAKGDSLRLRDLNQKFYVYIPDLQKKLYATAVSLGYFSASPEAVRSTYGNLGGALLVAAILGAFGSMVAFSEWTAMLLCPFLALAVTAIVLLGVGPHMPVKSRKGAEAAALCRAFKTYLTHLEKYATPAQVAGQFEKYLPYAIAFGLERSWINRFKAAPLPQPIIWYRPYGYGRIGRPLVIGAAGEAAAGSTPSLQSLSDGVSTSLQSMSDGLNTMLNSAARTLTATPPPSNTGRGGRSFTGGGSFRSFGGSGGGGRGFR